MNIQKYWGKKQALNYHRYSCSAAVLKRSSFHIAFLFFPQKPAPPKPEPKVKKAAKVRG